MFLEISLRVYKQTVTPGPLLDMTLNQTHQPFPETSVTVTALSAQRGEMTLFDDVTLSLKSGDAVWIQGTNGIGKTTLLEIIAGLRRPESGRVSYILEDEACEASDVITYQAHKSSAKPEMTAHEYVAFWARLAHTEFDDAEIFERLALTHAKDLRVLSLSAGQKRRLEFARLIVSQKPVWIMDEPDAALDAQGSGLIDALVRDHTNRAGIAVIASHSDARALGQTNQTLHFKAGS